MIEQWLNEEITKKLKNRGRVVLIDQDRQWEFLATAAINKLPFYKVKDFSESWRRKKEELFLRCVAEEEHPEGGIVFYSNQAFEELSFLAEYCVTGGMIVLDINWVRNTLVNKTEVQVQLSDNDLFVACQVGIGKTLSWWKSVVQRLTPIIDTRDFILSFLDNPEIFMKTNSKSAQEMYIKEICRLVGQPVQDKPAATYAKEVAEHIFDGLITGTISEEEYDIYSSWLDSHEYSNALKKYTDDYIVPGNIDVEKVHTNHCFQEIDKLVLQRLVSMLDDSKQTENILRFVKNRVKNQKKNTRIPLWWQEVLTLIDFCYKDQNLGVEATAKYYMNTYSHLDRAMRRLIQYWISSKEVLRPLQERYDSIQKQLMNDWCKYVMDGSYRENQTGYLVDLIKNANQKIAVIVGDGVRYEVADDFIKKLPGSVIVSKGYMFAGLPSETEHNMSALYTSDGALYQKAGRENILSKETGKDIIYMDLADVSDTTTGDVLVLTYKDIDDSAEKMEQNALKLFDEYEEMLSTKITQLLHIGYKEVHLITDHGFVLTGILDESDKVPTEDLVGDYQVSERYIRSVEEQTSDKYFSMPCEYGPYKYVNFAKNSRPFVSTGKYGYSHGGVSPQELIIPNFVFTYQNSNKLGVHIVNKNDLLAITGNQFTIKMQADEDAKDILSSSRKFRVQLFSGNNLIDKSSILNLSVGEKGSAELALEAYDEAEVIIIDADSLDQLDRAVVKKNNMRNLGGLL